MVLLVSSYNIIKEYNISFSLTGLVINENISESDNLYASIDSLQRSEGSFIAFDMGLNLEDQLFRYGVRINQDLVQDVQCDKIPSVIGTMGGKPQIQLLPWPYFPLLTSPSAHPISGNLDYIVAQFPQSIDTVQSPGIRKTVLLATSSTSRVLNTPAKVEWQSYFYSNSHLARR